MNCKSILSVFLIFILTFGMCSTAFAVDDIPDGYTPIYTAEDLNNIRNNLSGKYILMNDIDLSSYENWVPIGTEETPFSGTLNGDNYVMSKINIKNATSYVGLFGYINSSEISNLTIENAKVKINTDNNIYIGLISGQATSSVLSNCKINGTISVEAKGNVSVGGIVGTIWSNTKASGDCYVSDCSNDTDISVTGKSNDSTKTKDLHIGGIAGNSNAPISQCSNEGTINLSNFDSASIFADVVAGGICGYTKGDVKDCYNIGSITATGIDYAVAGGIVGYWESNESIKNLYNMGPVASDLSVDEGLAFIGALIGYEEGTVSLDTESAEKDVVLSNCYYIDNGLSANGFLGSCSSINVKMLTKEEFRYKDSFVGFDFESVWEMNEEIGRPVLKDKTMNSSDNCSFFKTLENIWNKILTYFNDIVSKIKSFVGF